MKILDDKIEEIRERHETLAKVFDKLVETAKDGDQKMSEFTGNSATFIKEEFQKLHDMIRNLKGGDQE